MRATGPRAEGGAPEGHIPAGEFRRALGNFCTGVVIVTGYGEEGQPVGFTAQSLVSLSIDPPLVGVSPAKTSRSWQAIRRTGRFCVNILSAPQLRLSQRFAGADADRFADEAWRADGPAGPVFDGVIGHIDCTVEAEHEVGDHTFVVGRVDQARLLDSAVAPLLFFRGAHQVLPDGLVQAA